MRTDYVLYIVAVICFIIAGYGAAYLFTGDMSNTIIVAVLAIIGIVFAVGGYSLRPTTPTITRAEPSRPTTKPAMEEEQQPMPAPLPPEPMPTPEPELEPEPVTAPETEAMTEPEKTEEMPQPETPPPEAKKPARRRRERKKEA
jgi:type IV secretory pathway VirB10-like protein